MEDLIYVVSTVFIKDGKVLVSMSQRSAKKGKSAINAAIKTNLVFFTPMQLVYTAIV